MADEVLEESVRDVTFGEHLWKVGKRVWIAAVPVVGERVIYREHRAMGFSKAEAVAHTAMEKFVFGGYGPLMAIGAHYLLS